MKIRWTILVAALLFVTLSVLSIKSAPLQAQGDSRTFPETGKTVKGLFLTYWDTHGGLAQQGFPISEELQETSDTDGKVYTVQYFERAVFEKHPENAPPNDVLLSLLGNFLYNQKYPDGAPGQQANTTNPLKFPETGKTIGGVFRTYWQEHGGLAQQGFPITDEFTEISALNGKPYLVQYFERSVFEYHPDESDPRYLVQLSQLGTFRYRQQYDDGGPGAAPTSTPIPQGTAVPTAGTNSCASLCPNLIVSPALRIYLLDANDNIVSESNCGARGNRFGFVARGFAPFTPVVITVTDPRGVVKVPAQVFSNEAGQADYKLTIPDTSTSGVYEIALGGLRDAGDYNLVDGEVKAQFCVKP